MAEQRLARGAVPDNGACCRAERRRSLECMPMRRVERECEAAARAVGTSCGQGCDLCALLEAQNHLLCDILAAVNGLTAATLARSR